MRKFIGLFVLVFVLLGIGSLSSHAQTPPTTSDIVFTPKIETTKVTATINFKKASSTQSCSNSNYATIDWGDGTTSNINTASCTANTWLNASVTHQYENANKTYTVTIKDKFGYSETERLTTGVGTNPVLGFFKFISRSLNNTFDRVTSFLFGTKAGEITERDFARLPQLDTEYAGGLRFKSDIEAIIINRGVFKPNCSLPYEAYIITTTAPEVGVIDCLNTTDSLDNYLTELADSLRDEHNFEPLTLADLKAVPVYFGDVLETVAEALAATSTPTGGQSNLLGLEVKVKNKDGVVIRDWTKGNPTISPTDQVYLRWSTTGYVQCLPFFADNGSYALTRQNDTKMLAGNTETEGFNLTERTGSYSVECTKGNGSDISIGSIYLKVDSNPSNHGIDLGTGKYFTVAVDTANNLKVNATYTDESASSTSVCGPKYVGEIAWGDGSITKQPEMMTMECGSNKSIATSHTYQQAGSYTITIKRDGVLKHRETIVVGGNSSSGSTLSASPSTGAAPLAVKFRLNTTKAKSLDFGDGQKQTFACSPSGTSSSTAYSCGTTSITHTYTKAGTYNAILTGTDNSQKKLVITVTAGSGGTAATLKAKPTEGKAPLTVTFDFSLGSQGTLTFGDNTPGVTVNCSTANSTSTANSCSIKRTHTYTKTGTFTAKLVTGCAGTSNSTTTCGQTAKVLTATIKVASTSRQQSDRSGSDGWSGSDCERGMTYEEQIQCRRQQAQSWGDRGWDAQAEGVGIFGASGNIDAAATRDAISRGIIDAGQAITKDGVAVSVGSGSFGNAGGGFWGGLTGTLSGAASSISGAIGGFLGGFFSGGKTDAGAGNTGSQATPI